MNAKWMGHLLAYRDSPYRGQAACTIIHQKITRQAALAARYGHSLLVPPVLSQVDASKLLLIEARYARSYWRAFAKMIPL
ncbi:MAG TPA: hypothetical protein VG621_00195 [Candidatus Paceibacterota bacterium]|nr:hypothetical protein [Candidatus Paceibacterota bacterium]